MDGILKKERSKRNEAPFHFMVELKKPNNKEYTEIDFAARCEDNDIVDHLAQDDHDTYTSEESSSEYYESSGKYREFIASDLMAKGIGYDLNDMFIDDSEVNVPPPPRYARQPQYGGFFVNFGEIRVKPDKNFDERPKEDDNVEVSLERRPKKTKPTMSPPRRKVGLPPHSKTNAQSLPNTSNAQVPTVTKESAQAPSLRMIGKPPSIRMTGQPPTKKHKKDVVFDFNASDSSEPEVSSAPTTSASATTNAANTGVDSDRTLAKNAVKKKKIQKPSKENGVQVKKVGSTKKISSSPLQNGVVKKSISPRVPKKPKLVKEPIKDPTKDPTATPTQAVEPILHRNSGQGSAGDLTEKQQRPLESADKHQKTPVQAKTPETSLPKTSVQHPKSKQDTLSNSHEVRPSGSTNRPVDKEPGPSRSDIVESRGLGRASEVSSTTVKSIVNSQSSSGGTVDWSKNDLLLKVKHTPKALASITALPTSSTQVSSSSVVTPTVRAPKVQQPKKVEPSVSIAKQLISFKPAQASSEKPLDLSIIDKLVAFGNAKLTQEFFSRNLSALPNGNYTFMGKVVTPLLMSQIIERFQKKTVEEAKTMPSTSQQHQQSAQTASIRSMIRDAGKVTSTKISGKNELTSVQRPSAPIPPTIRLEIPSDTKTSRTSNDWTSAQRLPPNSQNSSQPPTLSKNFTVAGPKSTLDANLLSEPLDQNPVLSRLLNQARANQQIVSVRDAAKFLVNDQAASKQFRQRSTAIPNQQFKVSSTTMQNTDESTQIVKKDAPTVSTTRKSSTKPNQQPTPSNVTLKTATANPRCAPSSAEPLPKLFKPESINIDDLKVQFPGFKTLSYASFNQKSQEDTAKVPNTSAPATQPSVSRKTVASAIKTSGNLAREASYSSQRPPDSAPATSSTIFSSGTNPQLQQQQQNLQQGLSTLLYVNQARPTVPVKSNASNSQQPLNLPRSQMLPKNLNTNLNTYGSFVQKTAPSSMPPPPAPSVNSFQFDHQRIIPQLIEQLKQKYGPNQLSPQLIQSIIAAQMAACQSTSSNADKRH